MSKTKSVSKRLTSRILASAACAALGVGSFLATSLAHATLGGFPLTGASAHVTSSVMVAAHAAVAGQSGTSNATPATSTGSAAYSVNTVTLESGTVVREFVATSNNLVFAIAWQGPHLPNFDLLLGTNFNRFGKASLTDAGVRSAGPAEREFSASDLVVQSYGHLGHFVGHAYLPAAVPAGVSLSAIQ